MRLFLSSLCIIFLISSKLLAKESNLFCKTDWDIDKYPYKYLTIQIDFEKYVYLWDSNRMPTYYYDDEKYAKEDIEKIYSAEVSPITWDRNFIIFSYADYKLDLINLIFMHGDIIFTCELTKRKIN